MTYDYVLAFGDSTVAGAELILNSTDWEKTKLLTFSNQLANKLDVRCINYGFPGGSNDRSLRLLPEALLSYPNSLVLFAHTTDDRTEFFTNDKNLPRTQVSGKDIGDTPIVENYVGYGNCFANLRKMVGPKHHDLNTTYLRDFLDFSDHHNRYKLYNRFLSVQLLCQNYAADFVQICLYPSRYAPYDLAFQQVIYDKIDKNKFYNFDNQLTGDLQTWAKNKNYAFCPGGHIGQEAHDNFALELYRKVK